MKTPLLIAVLGALVVVACGDDPSVAPFPPAQPADAMLVGIFEGKFPCDGCQRLKTALALYQRGAPSANTYALREVHVGSEEIPRDSGGTWTVARGARALPDAPVYELQPAGGGPPIRYLRVDDNVLLLLDGALDVRVGNASLSFTLSRTR